jgi:hypothetical protein
MGGRDARDTSQVVLRVRDLRREEAEELAALRRSERWSETQLTRLVQGWYGLLGKYVSARLALVGADESLIIEFAAPPDEQAVAAAKEHGKGIELAQRGRIREPYLASSGRCSSGHSAQTTLLLLVMPISSCTRFRRRNQRCSRVCGWPLRILTR